MRWSTWIRSPSTRTHDVNPQDVKIGYMITDLVFLLKAGLIDCKSSRIPTAHSLRRWTHTLDVESSGLESCIHNFSERRDHELFEIPDHSFFHPWNACNQIQD